MAPPTILDLQLKLAFLRTVALKDYVMPDDHNTLKDFCKTLVDYLAANPISGGAGGWQSVLASWVGDGAASHIIPLAFTPKMFVIVDTTSFVSEIWTVNGSNIGMVGSGSVGGGASNAFAMTGGGIDVGSSSPWATRATWNHLNDIGDSYEIWAFG